MTDVPFSIRPLVKQCRATAGIDLRLFFLQHLLVQQFTGVLNAQPAAIIVSKVVLYFLRRACRGRAPQHMCIQSVCAANMVRAYVICGGDVCAAQEAHVHVKAARLPVVAFPDALCLHV